MTSSAMRAAATSTDSSSLVAVTLKMLSRVRSTRTRRSWRVRRGCASQRTPGARSRHRAYVARALAGVAQGRGPVPADRFAHLLVVLEAGTDRPDHGRHRG